MHWRLMAAALVAPAWLAAQPSACSCGTAQLSPGAALHPLAIGFPAPQPHRYSPAVQAAALSGVRLAIVEANARGGNCGTPFQLQIQGAAGPKPAPILAVLDPYGIAADSTLLSAGSRLVTTVQGARVQAYTLARRIYGDLGLKRIALLRTHDDAAALIAREFRNASRNFGQVVAADQEFDSSEDSYARQFRAIEDGRADSVVLWCDSASAARILRQMRQRGMGQPVFAGIPTDGEALLRATGGAVRLEAIYPFDPARGDSAWLDFAKRFETQQYSKPDGYSALAYDATNLLLAAICRVGPDRSAIRQALKGWRRYHGVTGEMQFDPSGRNIAPMYLATARHGRWTYRVYPAVEPYATVGAAGVEYNGPQTAFPAGAHRKIGLFGPHAEALAASLSQPSYQVVGISSDVSWGKASDALVKLAYDQDLIGVVATDRATAHLAEQIAVKALFPVVAISGDRSLTSANVPWIFRLDSDTPVEDAVRCLRDAASQAGGNRDAIRAFLASGKTVAGRFAFDSTGELR